MTFTIHLFRRFLVPCYMASNAGQFLTLPMACLLGFWVLITLLVLGSGPVHAE